MNTSPSADAFYKEPSVRRSRRAYISHSTFDYFLSILVGGAFLASLLSHLGLDDALIGIISSIASLAFLFQLLSIFVVQRLSCSKPFVIIFHTLSRVMFNMLYLLPFFPVEQRVREIAVIVCILLAYFGVYFVGSVRFKWTNSYINPYHRAEFFAGMEMISLATGIVVSLGAGHIIDAYTAADDIEGGFLFTAIALLIFSLCDIISLLLIRSDRRPKDAPREPPAPMREVIANTLGNKNFRSVLVLAILWYLAQYTTAGFLGTYMVNGHELAFSVGTVQIINLLGNAGRFALSRPFGRYSDRTSFARGLKIAFCIAALAYGINIFTTPGTRYLIIAYVILHALCMAGMNGNMNNILYSYVDTKYLVQATALKNSIGGLCGFGASLLASRLLAYIQASGNRLFGIPVYGQQILSLISFALLASAVLYVHFVVEKQKVMKQ